MADDAAGAVRRTPRPEAVEQLAGLIEVGLHPPAAKCPFCENARRAAARILAAGWQVRPVVLLRAEDCACPVGGDCPHGPEPVDALDLAVWLHAEAAWRAAGFDAITVKLAQINQQVTAERNEAVALCVSLQTTLLSRLAELTEAAGKTRSTEWLRACATLPMEEWPSAPAYKGPMVPAAERDMLAAENLHLSLLLRAMARKLVAYRRWADGDVPMVHVLRAELEEFKLDAGRDAAAVTQARAERDALQARLDSALAETGSWYPDGPPVPRDVLNRIRTALQGDQPAEPWAPTVGEKVTGVETQTIGQPTVTGWFHSSGVDALSWLKIHQDDPETAQRYLVATATLRPAEPTGEVDRG